MDNGISKETMDRSSEEAIAKQIVEHFKGQIKNGSLPQGSVLPSLRELGELLDVDIHPIRDAMEILKEEHLVKINQGTGTTVLSENEWKRMIVLLPDIKNWHWMRIHKEIDYFMKVNKWQVELKEHQGRMDLVSLYMNMIANGDYFGAIIAVPLEMVKKDEAVFARLVGSGFPLVYIGWGLNCWSVDDMLTACGYMGTKHLIEQGYKNIGIIGSRTYNGEEFVAGCRKAFEDAEMKDTAIGYAEDVEFAIKMLDTWLSIENTPDALFYQRHDHGEKCFDWLKSKRIQLGPDMGFIALDDTTFHRLTTPGPTAIQRFPDSIGKQAVDLFLELVALPKEKRKVAKRVDANYRLVQGRSTQKGPKGRKIYYAMNPIPTPQDILNSYYPPEPPMPPGYWNGY